MEPSPARFSQHLAIENLDDFVYGIAPRPVSCGRGVVFGGGEVIPEINFTLPSMEISESTWTEVRGQYAQIIDSVCKRAATLNGQASRCCLAPGGIRPVGI